MESSIVTQQSVSRHTRCSVDSLPNIKEESQRDRAVRTLDLHCNLEASNIDHACNNR